MPQGEPIVELSKTQIKAALDGVRETLSNANKIANAWDGPICMEQEIDSAEKDVVSYYVERAFIETLVLLEAIGLPRAWESVQSLNEAAKKNYSETSFFEEIFLTWSEKLGLYLNSIENALGDQKKRSISRDLVQVLRDTVYAITDTSCFSAPPADESEVHARIEAVLRCLFKDLRHKPPIAKPIKNFEPDTGLPSEHTLIEYKYASTETELKRISDEVLADTRGYVSKEWGSFIYVIYETKRLRKEEEWQEHLRECGVKDDTQIIVLPGEPRKKSTRRPSGSAQSRALAASP
jgi:hypothetical protein